MAGSVVEPKIGSYANTEGGKVANTKGGKVASTEGGKVASTEGGKVASTEGGKVASTEDTAAAKRSSSRRPESQASADHTRQHSSSAGDVSVSANGADNKARNTNTSARGSDPRYDTNPGIARKSSISNCPVDNSEGVFASAGMPPGISGNTYRDTDRDTSQTLAFPAPDTVLPTA